MRDSFHHQLDVLVLQLARMCDLAATAMREATTALLDNDITRAEWVIDSDHALNSARTNVEHDAQTLLALQAPVAGDLRTIVSVMHSAENVERMGDLAHHVALAVRRRHPGPVLHTVLRPRFARMGTLATDMASEAGRVVRTARTTHGLAAADDEMDDLHRSLFAVVEYREPTGGALAAVDAILLSGYYERFADHAVSVADRSTLARAGQPRHTDLPRPRPADIVV
ncbi:Phosphate transport system regulatory protein PhoU [Alloactinosynnema sp. L-07]|uniref:phosphate signaling complex protein PhoU n=1 Tax=Alloactinosynnema sp. L-07 TaxID=1653480 RepID=UPI00065F00B1|nr:phosphate signaling complex protein PhoU [Alloactinosynnema sp. L-07]CRK57867.1 Phosphate transport system regulatory protein PhoU [Alloactinosynnema sp. L-07]